MITDNFNAEVFLNHIRSARIPELTRKVTRGELALQEFDIAHLMQECNSLEDAACLFDNLLVYIAMSKQL